LCAKQEQVSNQFNETYLLPVHREISIFVRRNSLQEKMLFLYQNIM